MILGKVLKKLKKQLKENNMQHSKLNNILIACAVSAAEIESLKPCTSILKEHMIDEAKENIDFFSEYVFKPVALSNATCEGK
jgi:hypothetical protein